MVSQQKEGEVLSHYTIAQLKQVRWSEGVIAGSFSNCATLYEVSKLSSICACVCVCMHVMWAVL